MESQAQWEKALVQAARFRDMQGRSVSLQRALDCAFNGAYGDAVSVLALAAVEARSANNATNAAVQVKQEP